jgi:uncharacterized repeat protein (TIGR03803 family)
LVQNVLALMSVSDIRHSTKPGTISIFFLLLAFFTQSSALQASDTSLSMLASFSGTNGADPLAPLIQGRDGNFYGTTYDGGPTTDRSDLGHAGFGTVFKVTPSGILTSLAAFYGTNGSHPRAALVQASDGNFYGTTYYGGLATNTPFNGPAGYGTVFKMTPDGNLTMLFSFDVTNGACPTAGLVEGTDGLLYGTTSYGGASFSDPRAARSGVPGEGTIFRISTNGDFTIVFSFTPDTQGGQPMAPLTLGSDGSFYGIGAGGAYGWGEIFRLSLDGTYTPIAPLDSVNGGPGLSALVESRDGGFYGVAEASGAYGCGAVYKVSLNQSVTTIVSFTNSRARLWGSVVEGTDGNLYGTTGWSDDQQYGYVYQVMPQGDYAVIASFTGTNGAYPQSGMVQGRDGSLYGTTFFGGAFTDEFGRGYGAIFRVIVPSAAAPKLRMPVRDGAGIVLSWSSLPGRSYQLQHRNIDDASWGNLGTTTPATNSLTFTSDLAPSSARLYRALLLPE